MTADFNKADGAVGVLEPPNGVRLADRLTLIELATEWARRKALIAQLTGAALLVGLVLCFALPVRFTAITRIMSPQQNQSMSSLLMSQLNASGAGALGSLASGGLGLKTQNDLYVGLLNSRPVADGIIQNLGLVKVYGVKDMTAARKKLAERTAIVSEKSGLIAISATDSDRQRAAQIATAYTAQLRILTKDVAVTEAAQRRFFYEEELKKAKEALVNAEQGFQEVQLKRGVVELSGQARSMIENLATLRAQIAAKQVQVDALRSYSTERNPNVQLAEQELSSLQGEALRLERGKDSAGFADLALKDVPAAGREYLQAQHELLYQQTLYDLLIRQYDAARLDESREAAVIQVVEPAVPPERKSSPKRMLILALSALIGLFGGCITASFQWWRDLALADPETAQQIEELSAALRLKKAVSPSENSRKA